MKRIIFNCSIVLLSLILWGCPPNSAKEPLQIVSVAEMAVQSMLENIGSSDSIDSVWIENIKTLHELDQKVCLLAAQSRGGTQKSQLIGEAFAQGGRAVRVMESCCPCSGVCCGCIEFGFGADANQVSDLTLSPEVEPQKTIAAKSENISGINVFTFDSAEIANGNYIMTLKGGFKQKELQFKIAFKDSNWTIEREGFK